jgi:hypothetical protein
VIGDEPSHGLSRELPALALRGRLAHRLEIEVVEDRRLLGEGVVAQRDGHPFAHQSRHCEPALGGDVVDGALLIVLAQRPQLESFSIQPSKVARSTALGGS